MKEEFTSNKRTYLFFSVIVLSISLLFMSCSSTPSESDATAFINDKNPKLFKVKSLKKTNGLINGDSTQYTFEYEAELECLDKTDFLTNIAPESFVVKCDDKGTVVKRKGQLLFEKTEKGWRGVKTSTW